MVKRRPWGCRGNRGPVHGVEKSIQTVGRVKPRGVGQRFLLDDVRAGFNFPNDLQTFAEGVIFYGSQGDEMLGDSLMTLQDWWGQGTLFYLGHDKPSLPDGYDLTLFGNGYGFGQLHRQFSWRPKILVW